MSNFFDERGIIYDIICAIEDIRPGLQEIKIISSYNPHNRIHEEP